MLGLNVIFFVIKFLVIEFKVEFCVCDEVNRGLRVFKGEFGISSFRAK